MLNTNYEVDDYEAERGEDDAFVRWGMLLRECMVVRSALWRLTCMLAEETCYTMDERDVSFWVLLAPPLLVRGLRRSVLPGGRGHAVQ